MPEEIALETSARLVLTDSGRVQEETTVLGVPCPTLRDNIERPITITECTKLPIWRTRSGIPARRKAVICRAPAWQQVSFTSLGRTTICEPCILPQAGVAEQCSAHDFGDYETLMFDACRALYQAV